MSRARRTAAALCCGLALLLFWRGGQVAGQAAADNEGKSGADAPPRERAVEPAAKPAAIPAGPPRRGGLPAFRRALVPAAQLPGVLPRDVPYIAVPTLDWEAMLIKAAAAQAEHPAAAVSEPELAALEWFAELRGESLAGELRCTVRHTGTEPKLLTLDPWSPATRDAKWIDTGKPLALGINAGGRFQARIERSGVWIAAVQLAAEDEREELVFQWRVPPALSRRLSLALPENLRVSLDHAVLVSKEPLPNKLRRWTWQLTGPGEIEIRITTAQEEAVAEELLLLRPAATYEIGPRGLQLLWEGRLENVTAAMTKITVRADPGLRVLEARAGEVSLNVQQTAVRESGEIDYEIALSPLYLGNQRLLRITAVADLTLDRLWRLPQLRVPDVLTQEGMWQLLTLPPYSLDELEPRDCRQLDLEKLKGSINGESIRLQSFGKNPEIHARYRWLQPRGHWSSGLTLQARGRELWGTWIGELTVDQGELSRLELEIQESWSVESLECSPPELVGTWSRVQQDQGPDLYSLQLAKPLAAGQALRFILNARAPRNVGGQSFSPGQLDLAHPRGMRRVRSYAAFALDEGWQTQVSDDLHQRRLDPRQLPPLDTTLLGDLSRAPLYAWEGTAPAFSARCEPTPQFAAAELLTELTAEQGGARERYRIALASGSAPLERLTIYFSESRPEPVVWKLTGQSEPFAPPRRLGADEQAVLGFSAGGEAWELHFPETPSGRLELQGERRRGAANELTPALLVLHAAVPQRGILSFRSTAAEPPRVAPPSGPLLPLDTGLNRANSGELARWEYVSPNQPWLGSAASPKMFWGEIQRQNNAPVIWHARLESFCSGQRAWRDQLTLYVENPGRERMVCQLPGEAALQAILIDGQLAAWRRDPAVADQVIIPLDPKLRYAVITVNWTTPASSGGGWLTPEPHWPVFDAPYLSREWRVWSPADYVPLDEHAVIDPWRSHEPLENFGRLFGPLARKPGVSPWWLDPRGGAQGAGTNELSAAERLQLGSDFWRALRERTARARSITANTSPRFGDALQAAWQSAAGTDLPAAKQLWIDRLALRALGLSAQSPLVENVFAAAEGDLEFDLLTDPWLLEFPDLFADQATQSADSRGFSGALERELVLVELVDGWVLTTRSGTAAWPDWEPVAEAERYYRCARTAAANLTALTVIEDAQTPLRYLRLQAWLGWPRLPDTPWSQGELAARGDLPPGWVARQISPDHWESRLPQLIHLPTVRAWGVGIFLAVAACSAWWVVWPPPFKILLGGIGLLIALALPPGLTVWGHAIVWGMLTGQALRWLRYWPWWGWRPADTAPSATNKQSFLNRLSVVVPLILALVWQAALWTRVDAQIPDALPAAQVQPSVQPSLVTENSAEKQNEIPAAPPKIAATAARRESLVFVPCDANQRPTGKTIHVPIALWEALQATLRDLEAPRNWLIGTAKIQGEVIRPADQERPRSGPWNGVWQVTTLAPRQWVRLKLSNREIVLLSDGVKLDGQTAAWRWERETQELQLLLTEPGMHQVEVRFQPLPRDPRARSGLAFALPEAPWNDVRIDTRGELRPEPMTRGEWNWDERGQALAATLGPISGLELAWDAREQMGEAAPKAELELVQWLRLRPGAAQLDVRIPIRMISGQLRKLEFAVDERLRLLAPRGEGGVPWRVVKRGAHLELEFTRPLTDRGTVELSFLIKDVAGPGALTLPRVEIIGPTVKNVWLFGTVDAALEYEEPNKEQITALDAAETRRLWPDDDERPQFAYQMLKPNLPWRIITRPRAPRFSAAKQTAWLALTAPEAGWGAALGLNIGNGSALTLSGEFPAALTLDSVSVRHQLREIPCRWAVGEAGRFMIFLDKPLYGDALITLRGRFPAQSSGALTWHWPAIANQLPAAGELLFLRDANLAAEFQLPEGLQTEAVDSASAAARHWSSVYPREGNLSQAPMLPAFLAVGKPSAMPVELHWRPNPLQWEATLVTVVERRADGWWLNWDLLGNLKSGELEQLEVLLPDQCRELGGTQPLVTTDLASTALGGERRLLLRPAKPWTGAWRQRISCPLAGTPDQAVQIPKLRVVGCDQVTELLILPRRHQGRQLDWQLQGYAGAELPAGYVPPSPADALPAPYRVVGPKTSAGLRAVDIAADVPQVRLADYVLNWQAGQEFSGTARFDLEPAGARTCRLVLPPDYELYAGAADGTWLPWTPLAGNEWEVPIAEPHLPQRITVIFRGRLPEAPDKTRQNIAAPWIKDWEVEQTMWTIWTPRASHAPRTETGEPFNWEQLQLQRLEAIFAQLNSGVSALAELLPNERTVWYRSWERRLELSRALLNDALIARRDDARYESTIQQLGVLDKQYAEFRNRRAGGGLRAAEPQEFLSPAEVWSWRGPADSVPWCRRIAGSARSLEIFWTPTAPPPWQRVSWPAAATLLAMAAGGVFTARTKWGAWPGQHPSVMLFLAAGVWWTWFQPREMAVLLAVLALLTIRPRRAAEAGEQSVAAAALAP